MVDLKVDLSGITLDNPVIPASGTFGYGKEFAELYDLDILGSISFKGTTAEERYGNELPRIAECSRGMLNSVGLQNPGLDTVLEHELPELAKLYHKPVIANISGFSIEEYVTCARAMDKAPNVGILEVNISCPNVHNGGMAFGVQPEAAREVTEAVKAVTTKPVYMKLSPNVTDIVAIARACEEGGADGLSLINTLLGMRIDIRRRQPVLANKMGGFSGPAESAPVDNRSFVRRYYLRTVLSEPWLWERTEERWEPGIIPCRLSAAELHAWAAQARQKDPELFFAALR